MRHSLFSVLLALIGVAVVAIGCGDSSKTSVPTSPSPAPAPVPVAIGIAGYPGRLQIGQSVQLQAFARLSDGSTVDVTSKAAFSATRPDILAISSDGLATGIAAGQGGVRIEYQGVSSQFPLDVGPAPSPPPPLPGVTGVVYEAEPRLRVCLAGARVEVADGPARGRTAIADIEGRFALPDLPMPGFNLTATVAGYVPGRFYVAQFPRDASVEIPMTPAVRIVDHVWDGTFAPDQCGLPNHADGERSLSFTASADGMLSLNRWLMRVVDSGDVRLFRASQLEPAVCPHGPEIPWAKYRVTKGVEYELRIRGYGCNGNVPPVDGSFHVEFSRPE